MLMHDLIDAVTRGVAVTMAVLAALYVAGALH